MTNRKQPKRQPGPYSYYRDSDGCDDIYFIVDTRDGAIIMGIYFWDDLLSDEAAKAEAKAKRIVKTLNMPDSWINQYHVVESTLKSQKEIAVSWSVHDVQHVRPDLTEDQAWEVLKMVKRRHDEDHGITWNILRLIATEMYPKATTS